MVFDIYDTNDQVLIAHDLEQYGIADALVGWFFADGDASWEAWGSDAQEIYDTCIKCADSFNYNEDTSAYEAYLGVSIR